MHYYNEIDPYAAQWLRNLIKEGLIGPGDVDERSIVDVRPDDLRGYTQAHFFAGIGGWSCALRLAGWPDDRPVWTGSCPCQPLSVAGKRKGHVDERHLWPAFYHLISKREPPVVFGEQVASKDGREWLSAVRTDLDAAGYAVGAADLCATPFGVDQNRERLFFAALPAGPDAARRHSLGWGERRSEEVEDHRRYADWRQSCEASVLDDGLPVGVAKAITKGFGNAIVPQVAAEFIRAMIPLTGH